MTSSGRSGYSLTSRSDRTCRWARSRRRSPSATTMAMPPRRWRPCSASSPGQSSSPRPPPGSWPTATPRSMPPVRRPSWPRATSSRGTCETLMQSRYGQTSFRDYSHAQLVAMLATGRVPDVGGAGGGWRDIANGLDGIALTLEQQYVPVAQLWDGPAARAHAAMIASLVDAHRQVAWTYSHDTAQ